MYEDRDFEDELADTFQKLQPLYKQLLTYVRRKLFKKYGPEVVRIEGPLPVHVLGDIWAQDWLNLADEVMPYPEYENVDVSQELLRQGFTPLRLFSLTFYRYFSINYFL